MQFEWIDDTTTSDFDYNSLWYSLYTNEPIDYNSNTYNNVCVYLSQNSAQSVDHDCSGTTLMTFICNAN